MQAHSQLPLSTLAYNLSQAHAPKYYANLVDVTPLESLHLTVFRLASFRNCVVYSKKMHGLHRNKR